ncbi:MAG TPA: hypothetical protein VNW52_03650, partial [Burkholderiaceae bacterium]|nr:hypothetical protein [Burkholderiaceae bacterium]
MTTMNFSAIGLQARLWLARCGWSNNIAALLLAIAGSAWLWALPLDQQLGKRRAAVLAAQQSLQRPPQVAVAQSLPPAAQHLQQFYDALGESRYAEQQIKTLFALATKNGLSLNQADYKFADNKSGAFHSYTVTLPVKGTYAAIRPFCQQVLLAIPFASLDEINFKRDAVTNPLLDVKLRFT